MELRVEPASANVGDEVRVLGTGFEGAFVTFCINYEHRAEQYIARVVDDTYAGEEPHELGDIDYTVTVQGEPSETARVFAIDARTNVLAETTLEVTDGG